MDQDDDFRPDQRGSEPPLSSGAGPTDPARDPAGPTGRTDATPDVSPDVREFADLPPLPPGVVVPDDARALAADRESWLREQERPRRGTLEPRPGTAASSRPSSRRRRWARSTAPLPGGVLGAVLALLLAGMAAAGSLLVVLVPRAGIRPATALPLATGAAVRASTGTPGGLLPDTQVRRPGAAPVPLRQVRPAVLALVGSCPGGGCTGTTCRPCRAGLDDLALQASQAGVRLWLVGPAAQVPELVALARAVGNGSSGVLEDVDGALARAVHARGTTLVLVHADGVVAAVRRQALPGAADARPGPPSPPVEPLPDLASLRAPGAAPQLTAGPAAAPGPGATAGAAR